MRIFVVGMPGAGNLGDDLISILLVRKVMRKWPASEVGVLYWGNSIPFTYPDPSQVHFLPAPVRRSPTTWYRRLRAIEEFIRSSDLVLVGGGGLFQDSHSRFTVHKWLKLLLSPSSRGIPAAAVGVGFGPLNHRASKLYLQHGLGRLSWIQVRDRGSAIVARSLGYSSSIAPDIVAGSRLEETGFAKALMASQSAVLGCSIRPWPGLQISSLVNLITQISAERDLAVRLFAFEHVEPQNTSEHDLALHLSAALGENGVATEVICYRKDHIEYFAQKFADVSIAVSGRLHANILWQKLNVPVLPLAYSPKVSNLYKEHGGSVLPMTRLPAEATPNMFQMIDLRKPYELPSEVSLLRVPKYSASKLEALSLTASILELGYGLARSVWWRLQQWKEPGLQHSPGTDSSSPLRS